MSKKVVMLSGIMYPVAILKYFCSALEQREDVDLYTIGPYTGSWIPWGGGMNLPEKYAKSPTIPLDRQFSSGMQAPKGLIEEKIGKPIDIWISVDAGFYFSDMPAKVTCLVQTDPHCISGDMLLASERGLLYADELCDLGDMRIATEYGDSNTNGVIRNGEKVTRKLILETGQELVCTDDHLIKTKESDWIRADNLSAGDYIELACNTYQGLVKEGTDKDYSMGFVLGAFQGDGNYGREGFIRFTFHKKEKVPLIQELKKHLEIGFNVDCVTDYDHSDSENAVVLQVRRWGFYRFIKSLQMKQDQIPLFIRRGSKKLIGGYLAGLFAADGCSHKGRLQLTTKYERLSKELQTILFYLGVPTSRRMYINKTSGYKKNGKYWTLYIRTGRGADILSDLVVSGIPGKPIKLNSRRRGVLNGNTQYFKITKIAGAVKNYPDKRSPEPVYDVINSETESFLANGIVVHNCLNYNAQRTIHDYSFCMQRCYANPVDIYLPYAVDETIHYPMNLDKEYDVVMIGLQYQNRTELANILRSEGVKVHYSIGESFDEYREMYNKSRVGVSWSSKDDLIARVFEAMGMNIPLVTNRVPDLPEHFNEGSHYLGFDNVYDATEKIQRILAEPEKYAQMRDQAYEEVISKHTYSHRIQQIFDTIGV